ncbi:Ionotropic receptor 727 [Blattella germanica]|nr:Ionotropic receptor 727 [Blattella germanica]
MFQLTGALLIAVLIPAVTTTTIELSTCLEQILTQQFNPGRVIVFSLPSWSPHYEERSLSANSEMVSTNDLIARLSTKMKWPLVISTDSQSADKDIPDPQHGYVILLFPDEDIVQNLEIQIEALRTFTFSYNRRGKFIVLLLQEDIQDPQLISKDILLTLWKMDNIVNLITLIQTVEDQDKIYKIYTMFPYRSEEICGESEEIFLLDQWTQVRGFQNGEDLFPPKVPTDLMGCSLTVEFSYNPPFHMLSNHTDEQGNTVYQVEGVNYALLGFIGQAMNFSIAVVPWETLGNSTARLLEGRNINGGIYTLSAQVSSIADLLIPHSSLKHQVYVVKARPNSVSGNFLEVFSSSVWAVSVLVLVLEAILFRWYQKGDEFLASYRTFSGCLLNTWAVFLSASIDQMPRKTNFRIFFSLFVIYCFAVNTVFQSFFTSFLIEPGYEAQINSINDANDRRIPIMYESYLLEFQFILNLNIYDLFNFHRECDDFRVCLKDVYEYRKGAIFSEKYATEFYLSLDGIISNEKVLLHDIFTLGTTYIAFPLSKGHPLLERFNVFLRRCLESGLSDNYYSNLIRINALKNRRPFQSVDESYVDFNLIHLKMCFFCFGVGCAFSIALFVLEYLHVQRK